MTLYGECFYSGKYHTIAAFISRHYGVSSARDILATEPRVSCVSIMLRRSRSTIRMNHLAWRKPGSWGAVFTGHSITGLCSEVAWVASLGSAPPSVGTKTPRAGRDAASGEKNWAWFNLVLTSSMEALWHQINDWHEWDQEFRMDLFISREVVIDCYSW